MKTGVPRPPRGIDADILQAARRAARRSGSSVSGWLNDLIVRQAAAEGIATGQPSENHPNGEALAGALERLTRRVRAMDENSRAVLADIHARLDGLVERLDAKTATERSDEEPLLEDVGAIIGDLLHGLDNADETARSTVEGLVGHDERAQATTEAPPGAGVDRLAAIESEIVTIRRAIETAANPDILARLEMRVAELARTVEAALVADNTAARPSIDDAVGRLEARLDTILARLDAVLDRPASGDLSEELRAEIAEVRRDIVERDPPWLAEIQAQITGLSRRLEGVRAPNESDSVHAMLARLAERLARLESGRGEESIVDREPLKATGTYGVVAAVPHGEPGSPAGGPFGAPRRRPGAERSAEPDSVRPGLAALRELARSVAQGDRETPAGLKADFIAAARRAAQVAAEEDDAPLPDGGRTGNGIPGTFARIGRAIRGRRRTLLAAAAGMLLAVSAAHVIVVAALHQPLERTEFIEDDADEGPNPSGAGGNVAAEPPLAERNAAGSVASTASHGDPTAFAFAAPEELDSRFDSAPVAPPTHAFVGVFHRAFLLPIDEAVGSAELRRAATAGNPDAAVEVAARYAEGRLVPRDLVKAAKWYELAAEEDNAVAQYRIASLYERGEGVPKDPSVAAAWYRRAAEQGNTGAMHNLGVMMSNGIGEAPDYSEAVKWFRAAADRGVQDSQYNLGVMYARGLGVDRNLVEAFKWFALVADRGDVEATARSDEIDEALSSDDRAKARAAADAWRPVPAEAQANEVASLPDAWAEPTAGITEANRRSLVTKIQTLLAEHGYDPGPVDGLEGPKTRQAVRAFQRNIGLAETGTISSDLMAALADPSD